MTIPIKAMHRHFFALTVVAGLTIKKSPKNLPFVNRELSLVNSENVTEAINFLVILNMVADV